MKIKKFILFIFVFSLFLSGCGSKDYGAYWMFGKPNSPFNQVYLASKFDCEVTSEEQKFHVICINKETQNKQEFYSDFYETGEHWIVR